MKRSLLGLAVAVAVAVAVVGCGGAAPDVSVGARPSEVLVATVASSEAKPAASEPAKPPAGTKALDEDDEHLMRVMLGDETGEAASAGGVGPPMKIEAGISHMSGRLPSDAIHRVVQESFSRFRGCYRAGLRSHPKLAGKVAVRFVIDANGTVTSAANSGSQLRDPAVIACFVSVFRAMKFPAPASGVVNVMYPMMLEPG